MKLAFVSHPGFAVLPPIGSVEIGTREMATRMAARHDITVYGSASPGLQDTTDAGVRYRFIAHTGDAKLARVLRPAHRLRPKDKGYFASTLNSVLYWTKVAREIRREGYDVVHVANLTQAVPWIRRFNPDVRIVLHMHCEWLVQLDRRLLARRLRHVDTIIGVSDFITEPIRQRFPEYAERCRTVYNGVDVGEAPAPREHAGDATLLHVGRISPEKGHHVLVEALEQVVHEYPGFRLVVVGEEAVIPLEWTVAISADPAVRDLERFYGGSYLEQIVRAMTPEVAHRVEFVGRISHAETARHYAEADILVFPSFLESMGMPPVEAMAAGLPVIAAPVGGVVESVQDGVTGLFAERGDPDALARAILELLRDPRRRNALGAAGHSRAAAHFSWESVTAEFERALDRQTPRSMCPETADDTVVAGAA
jgi:spore coat protein SA